MAQFFCGRDTLVCDAYGIKSTKEFINTLSDNLRKIGAMDTLISDGGKYEISKQVSDLLRSLFIQDYQSEPYHQHQNKAENRFGLAKCYTNTVMNTSGCPAFCWLLCLQYITLKKRQVILSALKKRIRKTTHKYGIEIPTSVEHAFELDRKNGNNLWKDALEMEMYNIGVAFEILEDGKTAPAGYTKVSGHLIWSVKMDFTRKARWVLDGHKTP